MVAPENLDLVVQVRVLAGQWFDAPRLPKKVIRLAGLAHHFLASNHPEQATSETRSASRDICGMFIF